MQKHVPPLPVVEALADVAPESGAKHSGVWQKRICTALGMTVQYEGKTPSVSGMEIAS